MTWEVGYAALEALCERAHDHERSAVHAAATSLLHELGGEAFVARVTLRVSGEKPAIVHELLVDGELAWRGEDVRQPGGSWRWKSEYAPAWEPKPLRRG